MTVLFCDPDRITVKKVFFFAIDTQIMRLTLGFYFTAK